jgi:hypothetical protein
MPPRTGGREAEPGEGETAPAAIALENLIAQAGAGARSRVST